jgi:prepilin peptidase CpaA
MFGILAGLCSLPAAIQPNGLSIAEALIGFGFGLIAFIPLYAFRVMGAGDVKVFAVLGLWGGVGSLGWIWIGASALAGIHAFALLAITRTSPFALLRQADQPTLSLDGFRGSPYAAFMCIVAIILFVQSAHFSLRW